MSWIADNPPTEVLFAGPATTQAAGAATAGWVQVAGAVTTIQNLVVGATGASGGVDFVQPVLPAGFFKPGRSNQLIKIMATGIVSWVATAATTATWSFGVSTAAQLATTGAPAATSTTLITSQVFPNQSTAQTNVPWRFDIELLAKQVGFGTTAIATSILATGIGGYSPAITGAVGVVGPYGPMPPNVTTTIDASINYYLWGAITFGTNASASNTCTMLTMDVFGCN
jgi:hypothetical protein